DWSSDVCSSDLGQQQRVAIARALISRPTILFADEPTGNLDSKTGGEILDLLRHSVTEYGQTTVMVTHEARAAAIADRILFLADGLIVQELQNASAAQVLDVMSSLGGNARNGDIVPSLPQSLLTRVRRLPGVAVAEGGIADEAKLVDRNNKVVSHGGAPNLAFSVNAKGDQRFNPLVLMSGRWPS